MEVTVTQDIIDEIQGLVQGDLVKFLSEKGLSFEAMAIITQILLISIKDMQDHLDKNEI